MALSIKDPEADRLARELARVTGESLTQTVLRALRERLQRETGRRRVNMLGQEIARMQDRIARLPKRDTRSDDQILGYDERGLPS